tara:strand:+ start:114 stop:377 length:264 start_codon:yes stop_codon:yes gene_type:complete
MDLHLLDLAIQNNIIMYQRPSYQYINQLKEYHSLWYDSDSEFCQTYSNSLILDAIRLQRFFELEYLQYEVEEKWVRFKQDIAMNEIN